MQQVRSGSLFRRCSLGRLRSGSSQVRRALAQVPLPGARQFTVLRWRIRHRAPPQGDDRVVVRGPA
eukprot:7391383-Lingulodinium_polyedra.AAC.1